MNSSVKAFCLATAQRVARSFAASLVALLVADGTGVINTAWTRDLSTAGMAAVVTLLLCVVGGATSGNGPAFGKGEQVRAMPMPLTSAHGRTR